MFSGSGSGLGYLLILALPFLLLIFMMVSQRRRAQQTQAMQASLAVGEEVVTTSGLYGTIVALDDSDRRPSTSGNGVQLRCDRRAIGMRASEVA